MKAEFGRLSFESFVWEALLGKLRAAEAKRIKLTGAGESGFALSFDLP